MSSIDSYCERLKPSAQKKSTSLTLFEDLLQNSHNEKTRSEINVEEACYGDSCPSDCESGISGTENDQQFGVSDNGLIRISDREMIYETIKKKLVSSLSCCGFNAQVEAIHRSDYSGIMRRAKLESFSIYSRAMEMKCGGNASVKYAWYGASKNEINNTLSYGFGLPTITRTHGQGVYLSPLDHPVESMQSAAPDEDGLKHMLLCRVITGKAEVIRPGSEQFNPSSEEFDSGVDNLASPQKYIIWCSRMNTHILPEFVVSFRASSYIRGSQRSPTSSRKPNSDWMPFPTLITVLSKFLPPDAVELIAKHHGDFKVHQSTRHQWLKQLTAIEQKQLSFMEE
ncbi:hypothetical protein DH2020_012958 [Rehmannia glutinosa]|uniref:Poly [ADP-ribose] polymerase n=1 Tax=Rehmannia glutinosa TaxID=99300 RepID=A0ABR0X4A9_REHGL